MLLIFKCLVAAANISERSRNWKRNTFSRFLLFCNSESSHP